LKCDEGNKKNVFGSITTALRSYKNKSKQIKPIKTVVFLTQRQLGSTDNRTVLSTFFALRCPKIGIFCLSDAYKSPQRKAVLFEGKSGTLLIEKRYFSMRKVPLFVRGPTICKDYSESGTHGQPPQTVTNMVTCNPMRYIPPLVHCRINTNFAPFLLNKIKKVNCPLVAGKQETGAFSMSTDDFLILT